MKYLAGYSKGIIGKRGRHVVKMEKRGAVILVKVLRRVPCEEIDYWERYYYEYYKKKGHPIMQSDRCFTYIASRLPNVGKKMKPQIDTPLKILNQTKKTAPVETVRLCVLYLLL